jgi:sugar lactone lactonase YvrE
VKSIAVRLIVAVSALLALLPAVRAGGVARFFPQERSFGRFGTEAGEFRTPTGLAIGPDGFLFVTDTKNNSVLKFDDDGRYAGAIPPGEVPFEIPVALAFDSQKNLFVVEEQGCRVRKFGPKGALLATYGGQGSDTGRFISPRGIAINSANQIFIADSGNHRIQQFDANFTWVRNLRFKDVGKSPAIPHGLAMDMENRLWACYPNIRRVVRFDADGNSDLSCGEEGTGLGQFEDPRFLAFDAQNCFFVTDHRNGRIRRFSSKGEFLFSVGIRGSGRNQFKGPQGVAVDSRGNVFVADSDNFRVQCLLINEQLSDLNVAQALFKANEYEKALVVYQNIVKKIPLHREALDRIVFICEKLAEREREKGNDEKSKPYLDEILRIQPSNVTALRHARYILWKNNKGLIYYLTLGTGIFFTLIFLVTTMAQILTSDE